MLRLDFLPANPRLRRSLLAAAAAVGAALAATGCVTPPAARSAAVLASPPLALDRGPGRDVIAAGRDTAYELDGPLFSLRAASRPTLRGSAEVLDDVALAFARYVGGAPPKIAVTVVDTASGASLRLLSSAQSDPGSSLTVVGRCGAAAGCGESERELASTLALGAAQAWLGSYARQASATAGPAGDEDAFLDPRLPDWLEVGLLRLLSDPAAAGWADSVARRNADRLPSLDVVLHAELTPDGERLMQQRLLDLDAGSAGDGTTDAATLYVAQVTSVLHFLADEGGSPAMAGRILSLVAAGRPMDEALAVTLSYPDADSLPDALDGAWRLSLGVR